MAAVHHFPQPDNLELYYHVDSPANARHPVVAILQGSECLRVSDKYPDLIATLNARGIAVLRVEKTGLTPDTPIGDCPPAYLQKNDLDRRLLDLLAVVAELRKDPTWDRRLVLVGGSEGAMLAALAAPLIPEVRAVALISGGGGFTFAEEIEHMMRSQAAGDAAIQQFRETRKQSHIDPTTTREWGSDGKLARNTWLWLSRAEDLELARPLLRVDVPILVLHGARDTSTPVESARKLQRQFQIAGKTNLQLWIDPAAGHAPTRQSLARVLDWVTGQLQLPGP